MPIHVRANQGDYAEACLLPGDPLRAKYIAKTFMDDVVQRNSERGMLGYTGTFQGKPVSVQSSGMGCPSAAIVIEELVQLGVKKLMRVGTCGGLQPDLVDGRPDRRALGDPRRLDRDPLRRRRAARADRRLRARPRGRPPGEAPRQAGPRRPDRLERHLLQAGSRACAGRWSDRGILAVEMEAAILFTLGALRKIQAGCMLIVSDVVVEGEFVRITDEEMRSAVDQMTELALTTVTA